MPTGLFFFVFVLFFFSAKRFLNRASVFPPPVTHGSLSFGFHFACDAAYLLHAEWEFDPRFEANGHTCSGNTQYADWTKLKAPFFYVVCLWPRRSFKLNKRDHRPAVFLAPLIELFGGVREETGVAVRAFSRAVELVPAYDGVDTLGHGAKGLKMFPRTSKKNLSI